MAIRGLIFDLDGLIVDTETPAFESWSRIFALHGCTLDLNGWLACLGGASGSFDGCAELEKHLGYTIDRRIVMEDRRRLKARLVEGTRVLPGVTDWLDEARRRGFSIGLASSSPREWVLAQLTRLELRDRFHVITSADDVAHVKPHPEIYHSALRALCLRPEEAIALEDSPTGVTAAKAAGLFCLAVPNPLVRHLPFDHADVRLGSLVDRSLSDMLAVTHTPPHSILSD